MVKTNIARAHRDRRVVAVLLCRIMLLCCIMQSIFDAIIEVYSSIYRMVK